MRVNTLSIVHGATLGLLALIFVVAGIAHFTTMRTYFVGIVPKALPYPDAIVLLTGILEVLGGVGLLVPGTSRLAGICLMLFLVAVFPANIEAARLHLPYANPLWLRGLVQLVLIGMIAWATLLFRR